MMNNPRTSMDEPTVILADEGDVWREADGSATHWKIAGPDTGERFSVIHFLVPPRTLATPLHYHHNEDEYSYVLEGTLGLMLDDEVVEASPGTWVFKPRGQWHAFWNAGNTPCRIIEVVSPAGFENYLREVAEVWEDDVERIAQINEKYGLEMDFESVLVLCERFGLVFQGG